MIRYLTDKEVIALNYIMIKRYTPKEFVGVKDINMLQSALGRPKQTVFGEDAYPTIFEKAGALFASLTQNHAFHNANKRTGFASLHQFLFVNGYRLKVSEKEGEDFTVLVVKEKPSIEYIAKWIKINSVKR